MQANNGWPVLGIREGVGFKDLSPAPKSNFQAPGGGHLAGRQFMPAVDSSLPEATMASWPRSHHALFPVSLVLPAGSL